MSEFFRPYMTPAERHAERRKLGSGLGAGFISQPERDTDEPAPQTRMPIWRVERQAGGPPAFVKCPSRSGAKIFINAELGWKGPFYTSVVEDDQVPFGAEVLTAKFETVQEFAARIAEEKK